MRTANAMQLRLREGQCIECPRSCLKYLGIRMIWHNPR